MRISDWSSDVCSSDLWRLLGPLPQRTGGCSAQRLVEGASAIGAAEAGSEPPAATDCPPWTISTAAAPLIADPPGHRLWTANARVVGDGDLQRVGDGGYDLGARAAQIRDGLFARRSEEHTSELQSLMRISYAVFCL